jgi:sRNA-binding regulator protein Hfq
MNLIGPRKLIRPTLPARAVRARRFQRPNEPALASYAITAPSLSSHDASSHAEAFYFQKQLQTQTPMVFVLEDGEKIEGSIEWYDRHAVKVRSLRPGGSPTRVMIYKSSIKYLYKAGENQPF